MGKCSPCCTNTRTRLLSQVQGRGYTAWHKGNLDAFVREKGTFGGAYMRKDTAWQIPGTNIVFPAKFAIVDFASGIIYIPHKMPLAHH